MLLSILQQFAEGPIAIAAFIEIRPLALHRLLHHRGVENVLIFSHQRTDGLDQQLKSWTLLLGYLLGKSGRRRCNLLEFFVKNELIAILNQ